MKKTNRYFVIGLILALFLNIFFYASLQKNYPAEPQDLSVVEDHLYLRYPVYFVGENRIIKDYVTINHIWRDRSQNALDSYFSQANLPFESRGEQILQIAIDKLTVTPDRIYIYTKKASFRSGHLSHENFYYYLMSFVNTLTDGSRKRAVSFIFDEKAEAPLLYGVDMNKAFYFDESIVHSNYTHIQEFMRSFFVEMYGEDPQQAFRKLSREFKHGYHLKDFTRAFKDYVFHKNSEFPLDFIIEKEFDQFKVTVTFKANRGYAKEIWYVQERDGRPYVSFSQDLLNALP